MIYLRRCKGAYHNKEYIPQSRTHGTVALAKKYGVTNRVIGLVVNRKAYKEIE